MFWFVKALKQFADFNGRAGRQEFWMYVLFNFVFFIFFIYLSSLFNSNTLINWYVSIMILPSIAVSIRRLHDSNHSGWFLLVPLYNFYLTFVPGSSGTNEYGPDPKSGSDFDNEALDSHLTD